MQIKKIISNEYLNIFILIMLIISIRLFILEPFRIPSGSMKPTIMIGDFIFVNKFIYGINIPIIKKKININQPERGDIIVFKHTNKKNYIKRVIGQGYDKIQYNKKNLYINEKKIKNKIKSKNIKIIKNYTIINVEYKKEYLNPKKEYTIKTYKNINNPKYKYANTIIPQNSYFVLGDNRDNSEDSRFWGFVHNNDIVGKALFIWLSIDYKTIDIRWKRIFQKLI